MFNIFSENYMQFDFKRQLLKYEVVLLSMATICGTLLICNLMCSWILCQILCKKICMKLDEPNQDELGEYITTHDIAYLRARAENPPPLLPYTRPQNILRQRNQSESIPLVELGNPYHRPLDVKEENEAIYTEPKLALCEKYNATIHHTQKNNIINSLGVKKINNTF